MKKIYHVLAVAALSVAAAALASCSKTESPIDQTTRQPEGPQTIQFRATLAPKAEDPGTKAITTGTDGNGKEILNVAWAEGEQVAIYYQKTDNTYATATATIGVPNADGSASFTASLPSAKNGGTAQFVYPATLHNGAGGIDESKLLNQNGNLTGASGISTKFDAATGSGIITVGGSEASVSGTVSLTNQVCICKFHFDIVDDPSNPISAGSSFSPVIINDGDGHTYTITSDRPHDTIGGWTRDFRQSDDIYVALLPVSDRRVTFSTTYNTKDYSYKAWHTTLVAGTFYRNLSTISLIKGGNNNSNIVTNSVTIPDGGTYTLNDKDIEVTSGHAIECLGDATIILTGSNSVTTSAMGMAAIFIPAGKTLTIQGTGSLTVKSTGGGGAGIGGGCQVDNYSFTGINCGNIVIESGTIMATGGGGTGIGSGYKGKCGAITINGGTVTASSGEGAAGIGSGDDGTCGDITIGSGLTSLTVTMGDNARDPIGRSGRSSTCGTVTIDGTTEWKAGKPTTNYTWAISTVKDSENRDVTRWTLTHK